MELEGSVEDKIAYQPTCCFPKRLWWNLPEDSWNADQVLNKQVQMLKTDRPTNGIWLIHHDDWVEPSTSNQNSEDDECVNLFHFLANLAGESALHTHLSFDIYLQSKFQTRNVNCRRV